MATVCAREFLIGNTHTGFLISRALLFCLVVWLCIGWPFWSCLGLGFAVVAFIGFVGRHDDARVFAEEAELKARIPRLIVADADATNEALVTIHWIGGRHTELRVSRVRTGRYAAEPGGGDPQARRPIAGSRAGRDAEPDALQTARRQTVGNLANVGISLPSIASE